MSYSASKIYDHLYQGGAPPYFIDFPGSGIDVLVLCASENQSDRYKGVQVIHAPGDDDERITRVLRFAPAWIDAGQAVASHVLNNKNVLVTCIAGLNRSGFVTAVALHTLTGWDISKCIDHIQQHRCDALTNNTFVSYLQTRFG